MNHCSLPVSQRISSWNLVGSVLVMMCTLAMCPKTSAGPVSVDDLPRHSDIEELRPYFRHIEHARGSVMLNSDSRGLFQTHGIHHGLERAFEVVGPGLFGTPAYSPGRNAGFGDGIGWRWANQSSGSGLRSLTTDTDYFTPFQLDYADPYETPLLSLSPSQVQSHKVGCRFLNPSWMTPLDAVRFDLWYARMPDGGSFQVTRRLDAPPWTQDPSGVSLSTTGPESLGHWSFTWSEPQTSWAGYPLALMMNPNGVSLPPDIFLQFVQGSKPDKHNGVCVGVRSVGGHSALDNYYEVFPATMAEHWSEAGRNYLMDVITHHTSGWLLFVHYLDVNDCFETSPSIHGIEPGHLPDAYYDNMKTTVDTYFAYAADASKTFHLLVGSPQHTLFPGLPEMHLKLIEIADETDQTAFVGLQSIMGTHQELLDAGIFPSFSSVHQTELGSEVIGEIIVQEIYDILDATAPDLNNDGAVGAADLAQLLGSWGACDVIEYCNADIDIDGIVGPADLALLLGAWGDIVLPGARK